MMGFAEVVLRLDVDLVVVVRFLVLADLALGRFFWVTCANASLGRCEVELIRLLLSVCSIIFLSTIARGGLSGGGKSAATG